MNYLALARAFRPKNFTEVVGQDFVLQALSNSLKSNRIHHAYLFSGTRGVGKTSIARLLAKSLNCEKNISVNPCGICESCKSIEENRSIDLIEIDAASRTKVEDTREILDNIQYLPTHSRFKIYLIDEVHMLSKSSFNALLKTLEEPPEHVKFLLATTDPKKLPITVLSRCLQFHLHLISAEIIAKKLTEILNDEHIEFEQKALDLLANAADGSLRDALSLAEQAIAFGDRKIEAKNVEKMLGLVEKSRILDLIRCLFEQKNENLMQNLQKIHENGADFIQILDETLSVLYEISSIQILPRNNFIKKNDYQIELENLAKLIQPEDLQIIYQILLQGKKELDFAPNKKVGTEMTFLRALVFYCDFNESGYSENQRNSSNDLDKKEIKNINKMIDANNQNERNVSEKIEKTNEEINENQVKKIKNNKEFEKLNKNQLETETETETEKSNLLFENLLKTREEILKKEEKKKKVKLESKPIQIEKIAEKPEYSLTLAKKNNSTKINVELKNVKNILKNEQNPQILTEILTEIAKTDEWVNLILTIAFPNLLRLLLLNSFLEKKSGNHWIINTRNAFFHLVNTDSTKLIEQKINDFLGENIQISFEQNDDLHQFSPIDLQQKIYKKLNEEKQKMFENDANIQRICQLFEAKIEFESLRLI